MKFSLLSVEDDHVKLAAEGDIGSADPPNDGPGSFAGFLGPNWPSRNLIVNCKDVRSLGSASIGWLVSQNKVVRAAGGKMVLHSMRPNVSQVFKLIRIGGLFPIVATEEDALAVIRGGPADPNGPAPSA